MIPANWRSDFDEPHAGFHQAARQNALPGETIRRQAGADAIHLEDRRRLGTHVENIRNFALHPKCELERFDGAFDFGMIGVSLQLVQVEVAHEVELRSLEVAGNVGVVDVLERRSRLFVLSQHFGVKAGNLVAADFGSLASRGEKTAAVIAGAAIVRRRVHRDEAWQVGVFAAETVERQALTEGHKLEAAGASDKGLRMIRQVGVHAADEAVRHLLGQVGTISGMPDAPCCANLKGQPRSLAQPRSRPTVEAWPDCLFNVGL